MLIVNNDAEDFTADLMTPVIVTAGSSIDFTINFNPKRVPSELEERNTRLQFSNNTAEKDPFEIELVGYVELY